MSDPQKDDKSKNNKKKKKKKKGKKGEQKGADLGDYFEPIDKIMEVYAEEIREVQDKLKTPEEDELTVYRFLKGWKFDIEKTVEYIDKMHAFREEKKLDDIRAKAVKMTQEDFPHSAKLARCHPHRIYHGKDKLGQPVSIELIGATQPAFICKLIKLEELMQYHLYHMENKFALAQELSRKTGTVIRMCKIMDLQGLSSKHLHRQGISYLRALVSISQDNYPEMLGKLYIIRASWVFKMIWKIVRPWLQQHTLEKIRFLGKDWQKVLLEEIGEENLPLMYGGKCDCLPGGGCVRSVDPDDGMTIQKVGRRDSFVHTVTVAEGDVVNWEFRTRSKNIGFGLKFAESAEEDAEETELQPVEKFNSQEIMQEGKYECKQAGCLKLVFDNTFSRFTSKTLVYRVDLTAASDRVDTEGSSGEAKHDGTSVDDMGKELGLVKDDQESEED